MVDCLGACRVFFFLGGSGIGFQVNDSLVLPGCPFGYKETTRQEQSDINERRNKQGVKSIAGHEMKECFSTVRELGEITLAAGFLAV